MVRKNDIIDLTIEDLGVNGEGIGKVDGYTLFVKDGVIGDEVTVTARAIPSLRPIFPPRSVSWSFPTPPRR